MLYTASDYTPASYECISRLAIFTVFSVGGEARALLAASRVSKSCNHKVRVSKLVSVEATDIQKRTIKIDKVHTTPPLNFVLPLEDNVLARSGR
jgi:hypothetical protein